MAAVLHLVRKRLVRRRSATALVVLAVAGAIVVVGSLFGVAALTADQATQRAVAELEPRERAIQVNRHSDGAVSEVASDTFVRGALGGLAAYTDPVIGAVSIQPRTTISSFFALDGLAELVIVHEGRLPARCDGVAACEAIRIVDFEIPGGPGSIGHTDTIGGLAFTIVGAGEIAPGLPMEPQLSMGIVSLVDGVDAMAASPALADVARTRFWVAPLDPDSTHAWSLETLIGRIDDLERTLEAEDPSFVVRAPDVAVHEVQARTATAGGRLVFIGSFVVAVLLAFAVFAAAVEREDVGQEARRLRVHGAGRGQRLLFVVAEAAIPSLLGALLGWLAAAGVIVGIGMAQGATPLEILGVSLLDPGTTAIVATIALFAAVAVGLGIHPDSGRLIRPRAIALAVLPAVAVLVWDRATRGQLDAAELADAAAGPGTVLLPGLLGLSVILGSLVVMPPIFRRLARLARRAPLALRLGLISIARDPLRPTATMTLLAFSLGAAVFGLGYAATLRQGAADSAAFATGMDVRVEPFAGDRQHWGAAQVLLAEDPAIEAEIHPLSHQGARSASGAQLALVGIEADAIPLLRGWRDDFADSSPAELAAAIAMPGDWALPGQPLETGVREVVIEVEAAGDPIRLTAIVERHDGTFDYLPFRDLVEGRQELRAEIFPGVTEATDPDDDFGLPDDYPQGWRVVAITASNGGPSAAFGPRLGERQEADIRILNLPELFEPSASHHLDVSGSRSGQVLRPPAPTDDVVLPAIVTPDLVEDVDASGQILLQLGTGASVAVRPVATTRLFPTVTQPGRSMVIVDLAPLATRLNADAPGAGTPTELLIRADDPGTVQAVVARLTDTDFPVGVVESRAAIEAEQAEDPFAQGVVWSLAVGAVAGVVLSVLGILFAAGARLRDERGDLGELEEQGVAPGSLARLAVLQTVLVAILGLLVGAALGLGLGWLTAAGVAVGGSGALPMPPLRLSAPYPQIGLLIVAVLLGLAVAVAALARRHYAGALVRDGR